MKVFKLSVRDKDDGLIWGGAFNKTIQEAMSSIGDVLDEEPVGSKLTIELVEMTEEQYENVPYDGEHFRGIVGHVLTHEYDPKTGEVKVR